MAVEIISCTTSTKVICDLAEAQTHDLLNGSRQAKRNMPEFLYQTSLRNGIGHGLHFLQNNSVTISMYI